MGSKRKYIIRIVVFIAIFLLLFIELNRFFQRDYNAEAVNFYNDPENTMEVVFLGSSMIEFGINSNKLYEEYGIASFNLGNQGQPVLNSYYWLQEAYKYHKDSLKTVVFDVSVMRTNYGTSFHRMSTDNMKLSSIKYNATDAFAHGFNQTMSYLFPLFSYHTRWDELTSDDFGVYAKLRATWDRGQYFSTDTVFEDFTKEQLFVPDYVLDENAELIELDEEGIEYFYKMVEFCDENNLNLILIKTPNPMTWSSNAHNTFCTLAKETNLEFLDFNYAPLLDEINYDCMFDSMDGVHLNYYGSVKLASWLGNYLLENGYAQDVRGKLEYAFLDDELKEYQDSIEYLVKMRECMDVAEYLQLASQKENYTTFIMVKNDAAKSLLEEQREQFNQIGLKELAKLSYQASYLAVMDGGEVLYEVQGISDSSENGTPLIYEGELSNGAIYTLQSGGASSGDIANCTIEGKNLAKNKKGINIVVYDKERKTIVDKAVFNTSKYCKREVSVDSVLSSELEEIKDDEEVSSILTKYVKYQEILQQKDDQ